MKLIITRLLGVLLLTLSLQFAFAQAVMDPSDPVVVYSGAVSQPPAGQVKDWVKANRVSWSTTEFKCYIYKGIPFRLKFPKSYQHNVDDGKTYPVYMFFHGVGEASDGSLYDNEYQLYHGGRTHLAAVNAGKFDGFLLYPQNLYGFFGTAQYDALAELIENFLVPQNKADINRIYVDGLSGGGAATWEFTIRHPELVAAALPISGAGTGYGESADLLKWVNIWHFQGGLDTRPSPAISEQLGAMIKAAGGPYRYTKYPNLGHSCWDKAWAEPDFYNFMLRAHKANPIVLFGKYEFCEGENVSLTMGVSAGYTAYEWRKNGSVIPGATSNTLVLNGSQASTFGTYDMRIRRGTTWSPWSPIPVVVKLKDQTVTPAITTQGMSSHVIPAPDGSTSVTLVQPEGFASYSWTRQGSSTVLGTADTLRVTTPGSYIARVTEQFGCSSLPSAPFAVVDANGANKPDAPANVIASAFAASQNKVVWSDKPNPTYNETGFEVYQSTQAGGPYKLVARTGQDVTNTIVDDVVGGTKYYYVIRAINATSASDLSPEGSTVAIADKQPPTAPTNLSLTSATTNTAVLTWEGSTDDYGVEVYDIYINGLKSYVTTGLSFTIYNIDNVNKTYKFEIKARDAAGNSSAPSNPVFNSLAANAAPLTAPTSVVATAVSFREIDLSWADNSNNESGFQIFRSTNAASGFVAIGVAPANATTYKDTAGLLPSTPYFYRVDAITTEGSSSSMLGNALVNFKFNNNYKDSSVYNKAASGSSSPVFDAVEKIEGSHAIRLNGTSQQINLTTGGGDYSRAAFTQKTIAFWMKSNANTGNRMVVDLGGSDNGLAIRVDSNTLYAGVASANVRKRVTVPFTSNAWTHIALVYNATSLKLYINGELAASDLNLGFNSVAATSNGSAIGAINSASALAVTGSTRFSGWFDDFYVFNAALTPGDVPKVMGRTISSTATTLPIPAKPAVPSALVATGTGNADITLHWADNSSNETGFEIFKSDDDNQNYVLLASVGANATSFVDHGLFANSIRYYKVRAVNVVGDLGFSNEDSAKTLPLAPAFTPVTNKVMRIGTQLQVSINATSPLNVPLTLQAANLPAFATFTSNGGNGTITFNNPADMGTYAGITVTATDAYGSSDLVFDLLVNDNYAPVLSSITNVTMNESETRVLNLTATDQNAGDELTWTFTGLPSFITATPNGNSATLTIAPGYTDHGTYNVQVEVKDNNFGSVANSFAINVNDVNPAQQIYISFSGPGAPVPPAPWNNTNDTPGWNDVYGNFKDQTGTTTPVSMKVISFWGNIGNGSNLLGVNTGNNSGVFPDAVIRSAYWTDANVQRTKIYGLDSTKKYTFTLFGSRGSVTDSRNSQYTIIGQDTSVVNLESANNSQNVVYIQNVRPRKDTFDFWLGKGPGAAMGYINAMIIERVFEDSTAPAKVRSLQASLTGTGSRLNWIDAAFNETSYQVYRSTDPGGEFTLLNPAGGNRNAVSYDDEGLSGNTTFYYYVKAVNNYGEAISDTVSITTSNTAPFITAINNVVMRIQETLNVPVTVTDDPGDLVTLTATNLPSFATFTDNGDGTGIIRIIPGSRIGMFPDVTIKATDPHGAYSTRVFKITVRDIFNSVYVNFSHVATYPAPSPWNSFTSVPFTGKALTNLIDDSEAFTGISITQLTPWAGGNDLGATTGDNSGVFPDNVMKTNFYQTNTTPMRLKIAGLNTSGTTKYNLVFFGSRQAGDDRTTLYAANGDTVALNAANNTTQTAQLNGLTPDANGEIEFSVMRGPLSTVSYLAAMVIQSYVDDGTPAAPANLIGRAISKTAIKLTWSDKSNGETGFDVERATSYNGPYTVINTTAADAQTYTDNGLATDVVYYYRVRSRINDVYSNTYTNIVSTSTYKLSLKINFNRSNNAPAPWNNTARVPEQDYIFSNLKNDLNNSSGINMQIYDNFSGDNTFGKSTGNNSGIYPDNVLRSSWWVGPGVTATLKFSNLNQNLSYSFVFLGSRTGTGDRTTVYTIGTQSVSLNASDNTSKTVQLDNVKPNENGEVYVVVSLGQYAANGYLNGMEINGYQQGTIPEDAGSGNPAGRSVQTVVSTVVAPSVAPASAIENIAPQAAKKAQLPAAPVLITQAGVYPNPFTDHLTIAGRFEQAQSSVKLTLIDISGRVIYEKNIGSVSAGLLNYKLDLTGKNLNTGLYYLRLSGSDTKAPPLIFKLVRTQ